MASKPSFPRLIGVVHLPALAGSPLSHGFAPEESLAQAAEQAIHEARLFEKAGFESLIIENFGDAPFFKNKVPPETVASMAVVAAAVREAVKIPIGINVLRNDGRSALAIAAVTGCDFIRVNVLSGVVAADQGLIEGDAAHLLRERDRLHAHVGIFADVHVKHAKTLSSDDVSTAVEDALNRSLADAIIVSGTGTGKSVSLLQLETAAKACRANGAPLFVGSGATAENLSELLTHASGVIVSSALRKGQKAGQPLEAKALTPFARQFFACLKPKGKRRSKK